MEHHHTEKKKVLDRLGRAIGHLEAIRRMVEDDRDCNNVGRIILLDHIQHCVTEAVENGDQQALDDLETAVTRFVK